MEYGLTPDTLCDPEINAESMEKIRYSLMDQQSVFEDAKEEIKETYSKNLFNYFYNGICFYCKCRLFNEQRYN